MEKIALQYQYDKAAEIIKTAILQSQYEAAKDINRIQLGLYSESVSFSQKKLVMQNGEQMRYKL